MQKAADVGQIMRVGADSCASLRSGAAAWFVSLLLLLVAGQATCQAVADDSPEACRFKPCVIGYGLQIGTTIAKMSAEGDSTAVRTGPAVGGVVVFGYNSYLGLQGEVSYLSKGSRNVTKYLDPYTALATEEVELRYLQIALLGRLGGITTPDPQSSLLPRVYGGLGVAYLLSNKWNLAAGSQPLPVEDTDISAILGAGFDIRYGPRSRITIDFRYDFGLRNAVGKYKNQTSVLTLGLLF